MDEEDNMDWTRIVVAGVVVAITAGCSAGSPAAPDASAAPKKSGASISPSGHSDRQPVRNAPPEAAVLAPEDLGPGYAVQLHPEVAYDGDTNWISAITAFPCHPYTEPPNRGLQTGGYRRQLATPDGDQVDTDVMLFRPGGAQRQMADLREWVQRCARYEWGEESGGDNTIRLRVRPSRSVAGDSFLVEEVTTSPGETTARVAYLVAVRRADAVAIVRIDRSYEGVTLAEATKVANRAAARLCAATPTC
ncbi:MAG TPA: hypothetical protein VGR21_00540 [Cryptosporangiaceae bacterium]|nr:hypothetical protein [Cryptosporangiaceae bacterium]